MYPIARNGSKIPIINHVSCEIDKQMEKMRAIEQRGKEDGCEQLRATGKQILGV